MGRGALGPTDIEHYKRHRAVSYPLVCNVVHLPWVTARRRLNEAWIPMNLDVAMMSLHRVEVMRFEVGEQKMWRPAPVVPGGPDAPGARIGPSLPCCL